ncbi:ArsR/SmtB family transcription factor [Streptococcus halotolerans]|uniref:ArsR/SmtB family transcription factor n=1 Tax=Streptococcus halotolerans TaxID=1814128 RepID=UPI0007869A71|nr:metalloregulator ArsR/SmtB family transcription factor [Streptococcus halotolerans]
MEEKIVAYKNNLYQVLSKLTKGLGSEKRLEILNALLHGAKTVDAIAKVTGLSVANTSRHLQVLKEGALVVTTREGNFIRYRLASKKIAELLLLLCHVGEEQLTDMRVIENDYDQEIAVRKVELDEALEMAKDDKAVLLDVRPFEEFESGHLPNAVNLPMDEFESQKYKLPIEKTIIVYCRGRLCGYANLAAKDLQELGYDTYSLNRSFSDWKWG